LKDRSLIEAAVFNDRSELAVYLRTSHAWASKAMRVIRGIGTGLARIAATDILAKILASLNI
jgi:hypothetical protein